MEGGYPFHGFGRRRHAGSGHAFKFSQNDIIVAAECFGFNSSVMAINGNQLIIVAIGHMNGNNDLAGTDLVQ